MALRFAGLGSVVERSATKAAIAQASLSAARRGARSNVAHIAPEVAAAYTLRMTRTRVVFRCDQNIMRASFCFGCSRDRSLETPVCPR